MGANVVERLADELLVELNALPKGIWVTAEDLVRESPRLFGTRDGLYAFVDDGTLFTDDDLTEAEALVIKAVEDAGLQVYYDDAMLRFVVSADAGVRERFLVDDIKRLRLRWSFALRIDSESEFVYSDEVLRAETGFEFPDGRERHSVVLDEQGKRELQEVLDRSNVAKWGLGYGPAESYKDGWSWGLEIVFNDNQVFVSNGSNLAFDELLSLWTGLCRIVGVEEGWRMPGTH